jgi:hypothetical protein
MFSSYAKFRHNKIIIRHDCERGTTGKPVECGRGKGRVMGR